MVDLLVTLDHKELACHYTEPGQRRRVFFRWLGVVWLSMVWYGTLHVIWYGPGAGQRIRGENSFGYHMMVWFGLVWFDFILVTFDQVLSDLVRFGLV